MLIYTIFMSATMLIMGVFLKRNASSKINSYLGYRSKKSMINEETWSFAQKTAGKIYMQLSVVNLISFSVIYYFIRDMENYKDMFLICAHLEIGLLIVGILFVEKKLKKFLNENDYKQSN